MATSVAECKQLVLAQRKSGKSYMMMETVVYSREYLFVKRCTTKASWAASSFSAAAISKTWTAGPITGPAFPPCTRRHPLRQPLPGSAWKACRERRVSWLRADSRRSHQALQQSFRPGNRDVQNQGLGRGRRGDAKPVRYGPAVPARASTRREASGPSSGSNWKMKTP